MQIEWFNLEQMLEMNNLSSTEDLVIFYETDPKLKDYIGFDPQKSGLRVFTVGYYPMMPENFISDDDEMSFTPDKPVICSIYATTKKWIEESRVLYETELDLEGIVGLGE